MTHLHNFIPAIYRRLFHFLEIFLANAAERADPICRKVFESCSRSDAVVRIAGCRIVFVSADNTNVLFHINYS